MSYATDVVGEVFKRLGLFGEDGCKISGFLKDSDSLTHIEDLIFALKTSINRGLATRVFVNSEFWYKVSVDEFRSRNKEREITKAVSDLLTDVSGKKGKE